MKESFSVTGMSCSGCEVDVKQRLGSHQHVNQVEVDLQNHKIHLDMEKKVSLPELQEVMGGTASKYQLTQMASAVPETPASPVYQTYKPLMIITAYLVTVPTLVQWSSGQWDIMTWMMQFMAGFFLTFSFFKWLDIRDFAESYAHYDLIAAKWKSWGYVYATIELGLGMAYLTGIYPLATNLITFVVMAVSLAGVIRTVLDKKKITCACLGRVINLPVGTVTLMEDALMVLMSLIMIAIHAL